MSVISCTDSRFNW